MADVSARDRFFEEAAAEHAAWRDLLSSLPPEVARARPEGRWSAVDALVHVTAWKENALRVALLGADPGAEVDPRKGAAGNLRIDIDRFNDEVFRTHIDWTRERVLAWADEVDGRLRVAVSALPEERLRGGPSRSGLPRWCTRPWVQHSREHRRELGRRLEAR